MCVWAGCVCGVGGGVGGGVFMGCVFVWCGVRGVCVWCVGAGQGISLCGHACGVWAEAEA